MLSTLSAPAGIALNGSVPLDAIDFYKSGHGPQYPRKTTLVYSNLTARSDKLKNIPDSMYKGGTIFFGLQHFIQDFLINEFNEGFFNQPKERVVARYKRRMDNALGPNMVGTAHIEALHDLGYLPLCIQALKEGTLVPIKVPMLIIYNTHPDFFWLTNYVETVLSNSLWNPICSATTAFHYRCLINSYAKKTGGSMEFTGWQGHDFSARGMRGRHDAALSGAAHLTAFTGTDTVAAIDLLEDFYFADSDKELIGGSVPASEHSVACMGGKENELGTLRRFLTELYPSGIFSFVSDTWNFWDVINKFAVSLKPEIMSRKGKIVFRPDSGDPVKIICGDPAAPVGSPEYLGAVRCLWNNFGGTTNAKGYKTLDSHVGLIYGDSITPERCEAILAGLEALGFASDNIVFGIGSFTYVFVTRDTWGMAVKSTYGEIDGVGIEIFKDPATDVGKMKKSLKGLIQVIEENGVLTCKDGVSWEDSRENSALEVVFEDGKFFRSQTLKEIREIVARNVDFCTR